jgi:hypothetical protein
MVVHNNKHIVFSVIEQSSVSKLHSKSLPLKVWGSNLDSGNFDFIKISAQIINNFSKIWQNKKII